MKAMKNMQSNNCNPEGHALAGYPCLVTPPQFPGENVRLPPPSCNNGGYSNSNNFVVPRRMEEQYSVQTMNSADQQRHRHNGTPIASVFPPDPVHTAQPVGPESGATLPYTKNGTPYGPNIPQPNQSSQSNAENDESSTNLYKLYAYHTNILGRIHRSINKQHMDTSEELQVCKRLLENSEKDREIYISKINSLQQDKEELTHHFEENIRGAREETELIKKELVEWRDNALMLGEQIKCLHNEMSQHKSDIESRDKHIITLQNQLDGVAGVVGKMEVREKILLQDLDNANEKLMMSEAARKRKDGDILRVTAERNETRIQLQKMSDNLTEIKNESDLKLGEQIRQQAELLEMIQNLERQNAELKQEIEDNKTVLEQESATSTQLREELLEFKKRLENREKEIIHIVGTNRILKQDYEFLKTRSEEQKVRVRKTLAENLSLTETIKKLKHELNEEQELKKRILEQEIQSYQKRTLLHQLLRDKMQDDPHPLFFAGTSTAALELQQTPSCEECLPHTPVDVVAENVEPSPNSGQDSIIGGIKRRNSSASSPEERSTNAKRSNNDEIESAAALKQESSLSHSRPNKVNDQPTHCEELTSTDSMNIGNAEIQSQSNTRSFSVGRSRWSPSCPRNEVERDDRQHVVISMPKVGINLSKIKDNLNKRH